MHHRCEDRDHMHTKAACPSEIAHGIWGPTSCPGNCLDDCPLSVHWDKLPSLFSFEYCVEDDALIAQDDVAAGGAAKLDGVPLVLVIALLAVPGFVIKQFINCVQLRSAMQLLVATDQNQDSQSKRKTKQALDALAKMQ